MNNIVTVVLDSPTFGTAPRIYQYNYGQILRIQGGNFPKAVEVHFSLREKSGESITRIGVTQDGVTEVPIPELMLENYDSIENYDFWAYIYVEDGTSGTTECKIRIPVKARSKPEVPGTPEEPELFRETVKAVNYAADRAEQAEQNAKSSETEAGKYATSASESAVAAEKTKEEALREVGEKKREAIEAIQNQEETSARKIVNHTDNEIQWIQNQTAGSKRELEQTIANAGSSKEELDESIQTAGDTKTALDKSTELSGTAKTELDTSTQKAGEAKTALDGSARTAGEMQETLSATVKQAGALDTSLGEKIETGTQLNEDITASGEKAVQDIQAAGSEQLGKMQTVAEEFAADREQITTNKEDISSLKDEMNKNFLDDAKTKRSLDALWKLNQGISYQFETDTERAYQKDIPSGAKLASVKKIGGRTIVWNQLLKVVDRKKYSESGITYNYDKENNFITISGTAEKNAYFPVTDYFESTHKFYLKSGLMGSENTILVYNDLNMMEYADRNNGTIFTFDGRGRLYGRVCNGYTADDLTLKIMLIDLTKMFGAGNEPSTPEEFEAMFPEEYYEYNDGTLMSMPVNEVVEQGRNLLHDYFKTGEASGIISIRNGDGSLAMSGTSTSNTLRMIGRVLVEKGKKYKLTGAPVGGSPKTYRLWVESSLAFPQGNRLTDTGAGGEATALEDDTISVNIQVMIGVTVKDLTFRPMLTYANTEGDFSVYRKNTYAIPQAILALDGYGDGVSEEVYNYVDWENKEYHKRVGRVDLTGAEKWSISGESTGDTIMFQTNISPDIVGDNTYRSVLCNLFNANNNLYSSDTEGVANFIASSGQYIRVRIAKNTASDVSEFQDWLSNNSLNICYELAEEEIIDISDIIDSNFQEPFEVEAGGTLTFQNSNGDGYKIPVPNEEEYIVSLAEVGGGASE